MIILVKIVDFDIINRGELCQEMKDFWSKSTIAPVFKIGGRKSFGLIVDRIFQGLFADHILHRGIAEFLIGRKFSVQERHLARRTFPASKRIDLSVSMDAQYNIGTPISTKIGTIYFKTSTLSTKTVPPYNIGWMRISDNSDLGSQTTLSGLSADDSEISVSDTNGCALLETYPFPNQMLYKKPLYPYNVSANQMEEPRSKSIVVTALLSLNKTMAQRPGQFLSFWPEDTQ